MGWNYDSGLVVGWEVEHDELVEYLIKHQIGSCQGWYLIDKETGEVKIVDYDPDAEENTTEEKKPRLVRVSGEQCVCGMSEDGECWKEGVFPPGVFFVKSNEYPDNCPDDACRYFVSLTNEETRELDMDQFTEILKNLDVLEAARKLASEIGNKNEKPTIYSICENT